MCASTNCGKNNQHNECGNAEPLDDDCGCTGDAGTMDVNCGGTGAAGTMDDDCGGTLNDDCGGPGAARIDCRDTGTLGTLGTLDDDCGGTEAAGTMDDDCGGTAGTRDDDCGGTGAAGTKDDDCGGTGAAGTLDDCGEAAGTTNNATIVTYEGTIVKAGYCGVDNCGLVNQGRVCEDMQRMSCGTKDCESSVIQNMCEGTIVRGKDYNCGDGIVGRKLMGKVLYEKKNIGQEIIKDTDGRLKLRKVVDLGLIMSSKKRIVGQSTGRQSLRRNVIEHVVNAEEMTVGRKLSFENVRPQNNANRQDDISNLRREVTLEDLKTHKLVKKKISMFEDKQGREKKEEFGRERSLRRKPEATARSEDVMKVQKTPMKKIKIRKMEDKMTPTSWKKRKRSAIRGLQEELATKRGGGMMEKIVGGLRLGVASARRNLGTLKDVNLETDKLEDTSLLTEVSSPLNGTQVR